VGDALIVTVSTTADQPRQRAGLSRARFAELAGIDPAGLQIRTFDVEPNAAPIAAPRALAARGDVRRAPAPSRSAYHVAFTGRAGRRAVVVVRTDGNAVTSVRRLERKSAIDATDA
jgi:hypothetical protein